MTRPILLALAALIVAGWVRRSVRRWEAAFDVDDPYDMPVPMTAWDGTATYNPNSHTVRIRWAPTITEV